MCILHRYRGILLLRVLSSSPECTTHRGDVLQQHHRCNLVHICMIISHSLLPLDCVGQRPGDTERLLRSQGKIGMRRSCSSGIPRCLQDIAQSCEKNALCSVVLVEALSFPLTPCTEILGLSPSRRACHSIGREREQLRTCSSKMVP